MTTYSAVTSAQKAVNAGLTFELVDKLTNNHLAVQEGDVSAPKIQDAALDGLPWGSSAYGAASVDQTAIGNNAVGQGEMKTSTADQSVAVNDNNRSVIALTGADYTTHFGYGVTSDAGANVLRDSANGTSSYTYDVGFFNNSGYNTTVYCRSRYIQASPPYNLGDGDIPVFIFALVETGTGIIKETSVAIDPPWAYHGSHSITPDRIDKVTGKKYKTIPEYMRDNINIESMLRSGNQAQREQAIDTLRNGAVTEIELDDAYKNQDMNQVPHPFKNDLTGHTVVMIDPVSDLTLDLYETHKHLATADDSISRLLADDYLRLDNTPIVRQAPSGIMVVGANWRNT